MKTPLNDFTFLIPVRIDSAIRIENILAIISYLRRKFTTHILVLEASSYKSDILKRLLPKDVEYYFVEDKDPVFYRTYYLNCMASKVKTPYLAIWDTDVIAPVEQMMAAADELRNGRADIAFPYDGSFLEVSEIIRALYIQSKRMSILTRHKEKMKDLYPSKDMKGGAIFVNVRKYIEAGMENERFYGWGPEDFERYDRWKGLSYVIFRSKGSLFHLTHPRDMNGRHNSKQQMLISNHELYTIRNSSPQEITERINKQ